LIRTITNASRGQVRALYNLTTGVFSGQTQCLGEVATS
jgi:hypothetical protein